MSQTPSVALAELRARDYARLDHLGHVYLDYTGAGLYGESQVRSHLALLSANVFGNPHSASLASEAATQLVEHTRYSILSYFHAAPDEYEVIFTLNASGALKLVGESYPFAAGGQYLLTYDNHNSVNGIREFAGRHGADIRYVPITDPDLRLDDATVFAALEAPVQGPKLFAYPAQSNFSGVQHGLDWIALAQDHGWDVLLDAAAFVPTNRLDLSTVHPDFVALSFYKIFGYPTGVGCLIARKAALERLRRPWFAGGTVYLASAPPAGQSGGYVLRRGGAAFEDGTLNFLSIPAVEIGLKHIERIGIDLIHDHVHSLTGRLLARLPLLRHRNGTPLVHVYGPALNEGRGATIAMNFFDARGSLVHPVAVEREAAEARISLRTGCHCNPGAGETALHIDEHELAELFRIDDPLRHRRFLHAADRMKEGALRVSLGLVSNEADLTAFLNFAERFLDS